MHGSGGQSMAIGDTGGTGGSSAMMSGTGGLSATGGDDGQGTGGSPSAPARCSSFASGVSQGDLDRGAGNEISGVVASRQHQDLLWVHNDSGDAARIYAIHTSGTLLATVELSGVNANDYEDIAIDPQNRIYVGDIGGNAPDKLSSFEVHRFDEPLVDPTGATGTIRVSPERLTLNYPAGAHDAETLLVDPSTGDLFVLTKTGGTSVLFRAAAPLVAGSNVTLEQVHSLELGGELTTGGDISPGGDWIAVRTYGSLYAWSRAAGTSVAAAMAGPQLRWEARGEDQGEAMGFASDGLAYFTISEGDAVPIYRYACNGAP